MLYLAREKGTVSPFGVFIDIRRTVMYQVVKRDGKIAEFDISKISFAIKQAF